MLSAKECDIPGNEENDANSSLTSFQRSFHSISEYKLPFNIFKDAEFSRSRQVLVSKRKGLVQNGFSNKPNATRQLTEKEREKLFETSLVTMIRWFFKQPFGGFFHCFLAFKPEMSPESCAGEICTWKRTLVAKCRTRYKSANNL